MPEIDPKKCYYWELECEQGRFDQLTQDKLSREDRIDPQDPPSRFGQAKIIRLIPVDSAFPVVEHDIPQEAKPVCHRLVVRQDGSGQLTGLHFRIGHRCNGWRHMTAVDAFTRELSTVQDKDPNGC